MPHRDPSARREYARMYAERQRRAAGIPPKVAMTRDEMLKRRREQAAKRRAEKAELVRKQRRESAARARAANPEKARASVRAWAGRYPERKRAHDALRRAGSSRVPAWADKQAISWVYAVAKAWRAAGEDVHVDHVVPLKGRTVSGLHVHENLTVIPAVENLRKNNRVTFAEHYARAQPPIRQSAGAEMPRISTLAAESAV